MTPGIDRRMVSVLAVLLTVVLVTVASRSPVLAAAACAVAVFLVALTLLGIHRTGVGLMVLAFATAPVYRGPQNASDRFSTVTFLILALSLFLITLTVVHHQLQLPVLYVVSLPIVILCALLGSVVADQPLASLSHLLEWLVFLGMAPIVVAWWRPRTRTIVQLLWAYVLGQVISTGYALIEGPLTNDRYQGLSHHPNAFGLAGVTAAAVTPYLYERHRGWRVRAVVISAALVSVASIVMSGSRAAAIVAIVLVLMVPLVERSTVTGFAVAASTALVVLALPKIVALGGKGSAVARLGGDDTTALADQSRQVGFESGLHQLSNSPLIGSGLDNVELIHNIYLEVAVATGVVGLIFYVVLLGVLGCPLFGNHPDRRLSYIAWTVIGIGFALPGLWDRTVWVPMALTLLPALRHGDDLPGSDASVDAEDSHPGSLVHIPDA